MALNYAESIRHKLRALTGKNPGHEIGTGFLSLAEDVDKFLLGVVPHAGGEVRAVSGELVKMTASGKVILPAPTANSIVGVICASGETEVKVFNVELIFGDFIAGLHGIFLTRYQHVILEADGENWYITSGEPKREQEYSAFPEVTKAELEGGVTPSVTRLAFVSFRNEAGSAVNVLVGTSIIGSPGHDVTIGFLVPPGQKWKVEGPEIVGSRASTLLL